LKEVDSLKTSVVDKEYFDLNKAIVELQQEWKNSLPEGVVQPKTNQALEAGVPIVATTHFHFDIPLFLQWIEEVSGLLIRTNDELRFKLAKIPEILTEDIAEKWIDEALAFNQLYFIKFAEENGLEEWIPQFLAETAIRPYLYLTAEKVQEHIEHSSSENGCPVCGEPARLAAIEEDGKKLLHCPRCLAHWHAKRLECSHCGNEDHKKMKLITVEGDSVSQIQVCDECNGYIKVIDTRQYIEKPQAGLLDLNTLHLDFVAQENGYQNPGVKKTNN
jgi:FdhE protein